MARPGSFLAFALLALVPAAGAQHGDAPRADPRRAGARDVVRTIDGNAVQGRVTRADEHAVVVDEDTKVPLAQVLEVVFGNPAAAGAQPGSEVWLRSGEALTGALRGADDGGLELTPNRAARAVRIPLRFVQAIRIPHRPLAEDGGFLRAVAEPPDKDLLFAVQNEQITRLTLEVRAVRGEEVVVDYRGSEQTLPFARVYGLVFGKGSGAAPDRPAGPRAVLQLGKIRAGGQLVALDDKTVRLRCDEGFELEWPRPLLERIRVQSDALAFLSDLAPKIEQTPALDRTWAPLVDRGPGGGAIKVGGKEFARGLVVAPRTRLVYDLGGRYQWLGGVVGLEDRAGPQAHAILRVLADDKVLFDSGALTPGSPPHELKLPIEGVRSLVLEADFGKNLDLGDQCAFANVRVWRER